MNSLRKSEMKQLQDIIAWFPAHIHCLDKYNIVEDRWISEA